MAGIYPDSGVPAIQTANAIDAPTVNCVNELFYSISRCRPRFDPEAMNALLSEFLNVIILADNDYDCSRLDNLALAINDLSTVSIATVGQTIRAGELVQCSDGITLYWNMTGADYEPGGTTCADLEAAGMRRVVRVLDAAAGGTDSLGKTYVAGQSLLHLPDGTSYAFTGMATQAEVNAGTRCDVIVSPCTLKAWFAARTATQAQVNAGAPCDVWVNPCTLAARLTALTNTITAAYNTAITAAINAHIAATERFISNVTYNATTEILTFTGQNGAFSGNVSLAAAGGGGGTVPGLTDVGSSISAYVLSGASVPPGSTRSGAQLFFSTSNAQTNGSNVGVGTWRFQGEMIYGGGPGQESALGTWVRIS